VTTTNHATNPLLSLPAGSARMRVRGLAASIVASTSRLKAMAAERDASPDLEPFGFVGPNYFSADMRASKDVLRSY